MKSLLIFLLLVSGPAQSEIYKLAIPTDTGMNFFWWPVLPKVDGWHHDREHSIRLTVNAQAPEGFTFGNAETVIYARAIFKPRVPELESIDDFIDSDHAKFAETPRIVISSAKPITTLDGQSLASFIFVPEGEGNWEKVAYGEEGEFYIVFAISSRAKKGLEDALGDFEKFIGNYQE